MYVVRTLHVCEESDPDTGAYDKLIKLHLISHANIQLGEGAYAQVFGWYVFLVITLYFFKINMYIT